MRIDMLVYNRCTTDARVLKEARTLAGAGHRVRIVAVLDATTAAEEELDGFRIVRIDRNPIHYRALKAARIVGGVLRRRLGVDEADRPGTESEPRPPGARRGGALGLVGAMTRPLRRGGRRALLAPHKPLMYLDYYARAYRLVRADPPQALHAHDLNTLPVAAVLSRRLSLPLTYDAHELFPEVSTLSRREAAVWRFLESRLAKRADHLLTVCDSIAEEIERRYGVARPTVLLNCPPARAQNAVGEAAEDMTGEGGEAGLRAKVDIAVGEPLILYQGGFAPHRGLQALVRSARALERGTIVLMGWGRLEEELRQLIATERLEDRVKITGPVPQGEVIAYAAGAAIGVIPYEPVGLNNTYTTPNKLFDYMAAGLPVAASRLPELTRFVEGGEMGMTFTPGDPAALAAAINRMLADPERYRQMRERAREAGRRYTWEREGPKLLALYEGTAAGSRAFLPNSRPPNDQMLHLSHYRRNRNQGTQE